MTEPQPLPTETEIMAEFDGAEVALARDLLALRRPAPTTLGQRVLAFPVVDDGTATVARPRRTKRWGALLRGLALAVVVGATLVVAVPGWRVRAAEALGQMFLGLSGSANGPVTFSPAPPFAVLQLDPLPNGWRPAGQRYAIGAQFGTSAPADSGGPVDGSSAERVDRALALARGDFAHIVLGYLGPDDYYLVVFERAAQPGEALPSGEARSVHEQPAALGTVGEARTLTWVSDGTRLDLESNLSESALLVLARRLVVSQAAGTEDPAATPMPLVMIAHTYQPVSLEEAQAQVDFHIPTFGWVPDGYKLGGAYVDPPDVVSLFYNEIDPEETDSPPGFGVGIILGVPNTTVFGGTTRQPDLLVNGRPAEFWAGTAVGSLEWEADGFTYRLSYSGLDLSRDEVQRLAESLR